MEEKIYDSANKCKILILCGPIADTSWKIKLGSLGSKKIKMEEMLAGIKLEWAPNLILVKMMLNPDVMDAVHLLHVKHKILAVILSPRTLDWPHAPPCYP